MNNSYKSALLAVLGLASVSAAQAAYTSGDLLVGVYQPGVANTEVFDLGAFSTLGTSDTWSLSSQLAAATFSATLGSTAEFGVYGATTAGNSTVLHTVYMTTSGSTPNTLQSYTDFGTVRSPILTLANNTGAQPVGSGPDFSSSITIGDGGLADALGYNPASLVTGVADLWSVPDNGGAPVLDGVFNLNPTTEVLSFNAVPEPTTCGLIGGASLLAFVLRNKLGRKQA
jgi:hypothetical protein